MVITEIIVGIVGSFIVTTLLWARCMQHITTEEMLDPLVICEDNNISFFWCVVIAILSNIAFLPVSICYWTKRLCLKFKT